MLDISTIEDTSGGHPPWLISPLQPPSPLAPQGHYLAEHELITALRVREFKLVPQVDHPNTAKVPFNIDGDPVDACPIHVRILHQGLRVFQRKE